mmetsp:Transcript_10270/g.22218  ORF Transcript_10270/g.22218 Transcript_10270/m.22218 type:complete len:100 (+) Transcript_10270:166-465(+)
MTKKVRHTCRANAAWTWLQIHNSLDIDTTQLFKIPQEPKWNVNTVVLGILVSRLKPVRLPAENGIELRASLFETALMIALHDLNLKSPQPEVVKTSWSN